MNPLCISNPFSKWKRTKEPVLMIRKAYGIIKKYGQK